MLLFQLVDKEAKALRETTHFPQGFTTIEGRRNHVSDLKLQSPDENPPSPLVQCTAVASLGTSSPDSMIWTINTDP